MGVDLAESNGLIIGADSPVGRALAEGVVTGGVTALALSDVGPLNPSACGAQGAGPAWYRINRGDPIEWAQLFAWVRHDHGPLDWVCYVTGPATGVAASRLDLTPFDPRPGWPQLSLAAIVGRVEQSFLRAALITRLAEEEFRHRGGALLHVWASASSPGAQPAEPVDALWAACRAGIGALVDQHSGPSGENARPGHRPAMRLGWFDFDEDTATEQAGGGLLQALVQLLAAGPVVLSR